jgi:hypothetical protein
VLSGVLRALRDVARISARPASTAIERVHMHMRASTLIARRFHAQFPCYLEEV